MNILSRLTSFTARFRADMSQPRERYIHLNGAMYGSRGLKRLVTTPSIQYGVVIGAAVATIDTFIALRSGEDYSFSTRLIFCLAFLPLAHMRYWELFRIGLPVPKDAVIDKTGRLTTDPSASKVMEGFYQKEAIFNFKLAAIMSAAVCAVGMLLSGGTLSAGIFVYGFYWSANATWCRHASKQLAKRKWTIQTNPPKLQEKREEALAPTFAAPQTNPTLSL